MGSLHSGVLALALTLVTPPATAGDLSGYEPPPELVDLTPTTFVAPETGLVDTVTAADGGGLLAYVLADAADHAEIHVLDVTSNAEVRTFDISAFTAAPERMWFVGKGASSSLLVTARNQDQLVVGALYDAKGVKLKGFGPADTIAMIPSAKGKPQIMVRKVAPAKAGETYTVQLYQPTKKAKKIGKAKKLALIDGANAKLGFRLNHWSRDFTVAVGIKEGEWSKKEDVRLPDVEARFDLITGKMTTKSMGDLRAHKQRFDALAGATARPAIYAQITQSQDGVEVWRDEVPSVVSLDQAFELYDPKSLAYGVDDDGSVWLGLRVDPWNRPAIKRKKADLEYFDVFHVDASGAATRKGRVLAPKAQFAIGATAGKVWLIERNVGFDRGGKSLTIYE